MLGDACECEERGVHDGTAGAGKWHSTSCPGDRSTRGGPARAADLLDLVAARRETAADVALHRRSRLARDRAERPAGSRHRGERFQQRLSVWVMGALEDCLRGCQFNDLAGIHDGHPRAGLGHGAHIVRDQDQREAHALAKRVDLAEDLILHQHVKCGRRLVGDDEFGLVQQAERDHRALTHSAGEFVRVGADPPPRDADQVEDRVRPGRAPPRRDEPGR